MKLNQMSALSIVLISSLSFSENVKQQRVKINRYSYTTTEPGLYQQELLSVVVSVTFPKSIETVGEALEFILLQSGYQLDESNASDDSQYSLYTLMLPEAQRVFTTVTLKSVLEALGNESYLLIVNPVKRTISYQLKESYAEYISENDIALAKTHWQSRVSRTVMSDASRNELPIKKTVSNNTYYGPVIRGESLSSIVYSLSHYGVIPEKLIAAIYLKNRESFLNENINLLIEGTTLHLPREAFVHSISTAQANQLIDLHYKRWRGIGQQGVVF